METLLIINGILAAITIYFLKEFHNNFKALVKSVSELKDKFLTHTVKVGEELKSNKKRLDQLEEPTKNKRA